MEVGALVHWTTPASTNEHFVGLRGTPRLALILSMAEEWFDVVDEHDGVIGRALRSEVHRLGLRHRAVHLLVFNPRGEVFLQQRSLTKDTAPGLWDSSSSGHLNVGEGYAGAVVRELIEELGVQPISIPELLFALSASPATGMEFCRVYRTVHPGPFVFHPSEVRGGGWFFPAQVERWLGQCPEDFAEGFRAVWQQFRNHSG